MRHLVSGKVIGSFLVVCALVGTAALTAGASPAASAQRASQSMRGGSVVALRAGHGQQPFRVVPQRDAAQLRAKSATITINYIAPGTQNALGDNCLAWPAGSQAAFNYAASIWESLIDSSVPIEINACWANLGYGVLGHSATDSFHRDFSGAPIASTWYPAALANALHGTDLNNSDSYDDDGDGADADAEMEIAYSGNGISWYFGTDGATPMGQYDFVSVVLHEICHGLGFAGTMSVSGGVGSWGWGSGYPAAYDRFTENGTGDSLVDDFPNNSAALGTQLTGNSLYFDGPNANAANGGSRPKLYAPSTWNSGSSYSHLDEIFNGTANALMTYSLDDGEAVHDPGPVTSGILQDVGWTMGAPASNVSIVKQVVGSDLEPGDPITFTLSVQNSGTLTATTPIVTDTIPVEVLTPTFSSTLAVTATGVVSYVWDVEPLEPEQSGVITICGWIDSGLESDFSFTNEATISDPDDITPGNNTSSATVGERYVYLPLVMRSYPPPPPNTFYSVGDACILQGYATTNFGNTTDMWAGYDDYLNPDGRIARSLIQFDVSAIPAGTSIDSAVLRVYLVSSYDYPGKSRTITTYRISSSWSESSVTWNTSPSYAQAYGSASVTHGAWGWYSFNVTSLVRGWVNGTLTNYGIMLRGPEWSGTDSSWKAFATRESGTTYTPYLQITYGDGAFFTGGNPPTIEGALAPAGCGPAIADSLDIDVFRFPGHRSFETVEIVPCAPDE
jgi:uncharacterized repeat protein (TIGR01451 family)